MIPTGNILKIEEISNNLQQMSLIVFATPELFNLEKSFKIHQMMFYTVKLSPNQSFIHLSHMHISSTPPYRVVIFRNLHDRIQTYVVHYSADLFYASHHVFLKDAPIETLFRSATPAGAV